MYDNIQVNWVGGHVPTAYFQDTEGNTISEVQIGNKNHQEFLDLLAEHNFEPHLKRSEYSPEADFTASFSGHFYELYKVKNSYSFSEDFAISRNHEGLRGYVLTITSKEEENFIQDLLKANNVDSVWLGAHDSENEAQGEWRWSENGGAPEAGKVFYQQSEHIIENNDKPHSNWRAGEPNDADADEDCAILTVDGWNDVRCRLFHTDLIVEFGSTEILPSPLNNPSEDSTVPKQSHEEL